MSNKTVPVSVLLAVLALTIFRSSFAAGDDVHVISESDMKSWWLPAHSNSAPQYPIDALKSGAEGCVAVAFEIHSDGSVSNERVWHSDLTNVWASKQIEQSALLAAHQWQFVPASTNTGRIPVYTYIVHTFTIDNSRDADHRSKCEMSDFPQQVQSMINAAASAKGATQ